MAKKKGDLRVIIHLACSQCLRRTYSTTKNNKNDPQRLELSKYCPHCRSYTIHKETK